MGGVAAEAAADIGAEAYATGDQVAFARSPDLHTAAHEAAHVVQQRGGVQLKDGVGRAGDVYEQHADAVADRVVRGESAEDLLDQMSAGGRGSAVQPRALAGAAVQREGSLDPAAEQSIQRALQESVAEDDPQVIQARLPRLVSLFQAVPAGARMSLHARLAAPRKGDELAAAFHDRLNRATRSRLLGMLIGQSAPLPRAHDAITRTGFAAKLPADPLVLDPTVLAVSRFAPQVTARAELRSEYGPAADEPAVTAVLRLQDADGIDAEGVDTTIRRIAWPPARPSSEATTFHFNRGGQFLIETEIIQGGLVVARRERTVQVERPATDAEALSSMSPGQLRGAHAELGDRLAGESLEPEKRDMLAHDRNLVEFFAIGKDVSLEREIDPPDAMTIGPPNVRLRVSRDPSFIRAWIERTFRSQGTYGKLEDPVSGVQLLHMNLEAAASWEDQRGQPQRAQFARQQVKPELVRQLKQFESERKAFEVEFGKRAGQKLDEMLDHGQKVAEGELEKYGITMVDKTTQMRLGPGDGPATSNQTVEVTTQVAQGGQNQAAQRMAGAAAELAANQRVMNEMRKRLKGLRQESGLAMARAMWGGALAPPAKDESDSGGIPDSHQQQIDALQRLIKEAENAHTEAIARHTKDFPILAGYKKQEDDRVDMDIAGLEKLQGPDRAQEVHGRIQPVLDAIAKTRAGRAKINVWQEPRLVQRTMPELAIAPGSIRAKMVEDKVLHESQGSWADFAILALSFGLALVAAIPTGGGSVVVAGAVAAAEIGGLVLDIYLIADQLKNYDLDNAKNSTDLDKAQVVSAEEPSLLWLAVDMVATGIGLGTASNVFTDVARSIKLAKQGGQSLESAEIAVARVHRLAREGKLSPEAAERAEQAIRQARGGAEVGEIAADGARAGDARVRVTGERTAELSQRLGVPVKIDRSGKLVDGVEVHYVSGEKGALVITYVRVGANALVDDILAHGKVIRRVTRYNGTVGKLRLLWDRVFVFGQGRNPFPRGESAAWESFEELKKLDDLIASRQAARMEKGIIDPEILETEIAFFQGFRARHQAVVGAAMKSGKYGKPVGHIDSPDDWRKGLGDPVGSTSVRDSLAPAPRAADGTDPTLRAGPGTIVSEAETKIGDEVHHVRIKREPDGFAIKVCSGCDHLTKITTEALAALPRPAPPAVRKRLDEIRKAAGELKEALDAGRVNANEAGAQAQRFAQELAELSRDNPGLLEPIIKRAPRQSAVGKGAKAYNTWVKHNTSVGQLPRFSGKSQATVEAELSRAGFVLDTADSTVTQRKWFHTDGSVVRINAPHKPRTGTHHSDLQIHYHKEFHDPSGQVWKLDDHGYINSSAQRVHVIGKGEFTP